MLKIIADNKIPYLKDVLDNVADVTYMPGIDITKKAIKDADALIIRTRTKCNEQTLKGANIKMIASATIGYDHIDTSWCKNNGIEWSNSPGCNAGSVMQYIAAVFALLVEEKEWELKNKYIAVVGVGNVGSKVASLARELGMVVYEVDPPRARTEHNKTFYELKNIIQKADIVTFHTPLTYEGPDKTYHLCNDKLLSMMKKEAVLINTSRGEVVSNKALKNVLLNKSIGTAVIDTWEDEPNIDHELLEKVWIATPHIAGYSQDGKAMGTQMSVQAISRKFNLGMDNWEVKHLTLPEHTTLVIDCHKLSKEEIVANAILHTYPLRDDDKRLRNNPEKFEYLRGNYPVRREFNAYNIQLENSNKEIQDVLLRIGFENVF